MKYGHRKRFCIGHRPSVSFYKPKGIPMRNLEVVDLSHEELESLRLKNVLKLDQVNSAKMMNTSQSTFQRILSSAYKKVSLALVEGKALKINLHEDE
ncbi:MAG: hypothetical protein BWY19_00060 [bacterium ADurb.Bin212]|nr:MAG: hypothetical protein BWY19_00060 [bacterium ADurb.Bin212]